MLPGALVLILTFAGIALATWVLDILARKLSPTRLKNLKNGTPETADCAHPRNCPPTENVPDYISPIVGYRAWLWDGSKLKSVNGESWVPRSPLKARCKVCAFRHKSPHRGCSCGVYAAKTLDQLRDIGYMGLGFYGEVYLWGTVVEHKLGWRAQYAYPKSLFVSPKGLYFAAFGKRGVLSADPKGLSASLTAYRANIYLVDGDWKTPLWTPHAGYGNGKTLILNTHP